MKPGRQSTDGFVTRRSQRRAISADSNKKTTIGHLRTGQHKVEVLHTGDGDERRRVRAANSPTDNNLKNSISESLSDIDNDKKLSPRQKRKKDRTKKRKLKIAAIVIAGIIIAVAGWFIIRLLHNTYQIFGDANVFNLFAQQRLKQDENGRSNVLILGTTDEDPNRPGATLTDSIMILSVNQDKKDAYMFNIPRDLYVKFGTACNSGYAGKINEYFYCANQGNSPQAEQERMDATRKFIGEIVGMDLQYVVHVNSNVIKDAVNAVGGVSINVQSKDPRGVLDFAADWMCQQPGLSAAEKKARCPRGHYVDFSNGVHQMNGDQALWFSRARGTFGGYGFEMSNFDREKNQQIVLTALKEKATSSGTLTDFGKVTALMDAMGSNLRTNLETKEIRTVMTLASEIKMDAIHQLSFVEEGNVLMTTGSVGGASIVQPAAGLYNYSAIRAFIKKNIYATEISKEKASVAVLNGGGVAGAAQTQADKLTDLGMNVVRVGNAPERITGKAAIYRMTGENDKSATRVKLEEMYGVKAAPGNSAKFGKVEADFVIVFGPEV